MPVELEQDPARDLVETDPRKKLLQNSAGAAPSTAGAPQLGLASAPMTAAANATAPAAQSASAPMTAPASAPAPMTPPAPTVAAPAAPVDRVALASQAFDTLQKSREGGDRRALEAVTSQAAGLGQLGSGQWRSALTNANAERQIQLDTARDQLINQATEGSIADASTAYQQALASSQLALASELGRGGLDVSKGQLDLAREGQDASIDLARDQFDLSRELGLENLSLDQARQALAEKVANGQLSQADADLALRQKEQSESSAARDTQLDLAREGFDFQKERAAIEDRFREGQMSLAERDQALRELAQSQGNENDQQRLELAREQLAQTAAQFGASQQQQMELARLADATQNRQIDVSTAQGQNALLLELARIMGGPSGNVDPNFLRAVAAALGMPLANNPNGTTPSTSSTNPYGINAGGLDTSGQDNMHPAASGAE